MKPRPFAPVIWCFLLALTLLLPIDVVFGQEAEVLQLKKKVGELELKVRELETQLKACNDAAGGQTSVPLGWQNKKTWRQLKKGMDETQVKNILGEPTKVIQGVKTLWYYPNIYSSYVSFDEKGHLIGWSEPSP